MKSPKIAIVALGIAGLAAAMPPWWLDRGVLDTNAPPNDFAIANQGQAKWIAHQAREMFDATLPGGAGPEVSNLLAGFGPTNNHWPLNIGQLKTLADPFYARLAELGWTNAFPEGMQGSRPWTATEADDNDFAMVNLGQLKYVFSFDPEPLLLLDTDGDGIPDAWETALGLDPEDSSDALAISSHPYANGLTNLQVFENPGVLLGADFSTLGDGLPDWWKVFYGFNPADPDVAADDPDGDGWTNLDEYLRGSAPFHDDRVSLMIDRVNHFQFKYGFRDWATTNPPLVYLVEIVTYENGTTTETIDPVTGDQVSYVVSGTSPLGSEVYRDLDKNSPHTTAMLKANAEVGLDEKAYSGEFAWASYGFPVAWLCLDKTEGDEEMLIDAVKILYKFNLDTAQTNGTLSWVEIFTPQDDPATPGVDESTNVVYTARSTQLTGQPESPEFEINPFEANDGGYGYYSIAVLSVELTKPTVDEKFKFDSSSPGKLEIEFETTVTPDTAETRAFLAGKVKFEVDAIGASVLSWDNPGGIGVYNSGAFKNKATFTGLPANNSDFGEKKVRMKVTDCSGCDSERTIKTFYAATAANHPGGVATDPNWFYYYNDEEGGTDYTYDPTLSTSQSTPSVPNSIRIANNAYSGSYYIQTSIVGGQRKASGVSSTINYWKYFSGVVVHERFHVSNGANHGAVLDPDADDLKTSVETGTVSSDPNDKYSIDGGVFGSSVWDDECWAGGPIEKSGIDAADITKDWANPGSQWP